MVTAGALLYAASAQPARQVVPIMPRRSVSTNQGIAALHMGMLRGHSVQIHGDGFLAWQQLVADFDGAQHSIEIELYMLGNDAIGDAFLGALERARSRNVAVHLLLDGVGSLNFPAHFAARLRQSGVHWKIFRPIRRNVPWRRWLKRNHRKVFIIDGEIAWVSGFNVAAHYYATNETAALWADIGTRVTGPLVADLRRQLHHGGRKREVGQKDPPSEIQGGALAMACLNRGALRTALVHRRYLEAIEAAKTTILLGHSYFLPQRRLQNALVAASKRGVQVEILIPDIPVGDVAAVAYASFHGVQPLLRHGIRVFAVTTRMLHAKCAVVDGLWWTIGSTNLDPLSRQRNLEANIVGLGEEQALQVTKWIEQRKEEARELTHADWKNRPLWQRFFAWLAWHARSLV